MAATREAISAGKQRWADSTLLARMVEKIEPEPTSGCWIWLGSTNNKGYGTVRVRQRCRTAHRVVFELLIGVVPATLHLDHLCRQRWCVNPAHLEPVTPRENTLRGEAPSAACARVTHCPQGHPLAGENLYVGRDGSRSCRTCSRASCRRYYHSRVQRGGVGGVNA